MNILATKSKSLLPSSNTKETYPLSNCENLKGFFLLSNTNLSFIQLSLKSLSLINSCKFSLKLVNSSAVKNGSNLKTIGALLEMEFTYILVAPVGTLTRMLSNQPELTDNE